MIRYPLQEKETLHDAIVHASMMAGAEAQGGARDIGYVIVCRKCSAAIDNHKRPGDCERFLKIRQEYK